MSFPELLNCRSSTRCARATRWPANRPRTLSLHPTLIQQLKRAWHRPGSLCLCLELVLARARSKMARRCRALGRCPLTFLWACRTLALRMQRPKRPRAWQGGTERESLEAWSWFLVKRAAAFRSLLAGVNNDACLLPRRSQTRTRPRTHSCHTTIVGRPGEYSRSCYD